MRPKYLYVLDDKTHVHGNDPRCLTIQQGDLIGNGPDSRVYLDRENLAKLRDAIDEYLAVEPA